MKTKTLLLSTALITVGFLTSVAQNNFPLQDRLNQRNSNFDYPDYETPNFPMLKNAKSGQDWWEPDTVYAFFASSGEVYQGPRFIFKYNSQGLIKERIYQSDESQFLPAMLNISIYEYDSKNNWLTELCQSWYNNSWINIYSYTNTYDSNNNRLTRLWQQWQNSLLVNSSLTTCTYDSNNNKLSELRQNWQNSSWVNSISYTYTYDSNNNKLSELKQDWQNNSWVNDIFTYDSNNNLLTQTTETWRNSSLESLYNTIFTYDSNNNLLNVLQQSYKYNSWVNLNQYTYTYDSNNNVLTYLVKLDGVFYRFETYTYDSNNNMITELWQSGHNNSSWENLILYNYTYDSNDNLLLKLYQVWYNNSWEDLSQYRWTYDENGNSASVEWFVNHNGFWRPIYEPVELLTLYYNNKQSNFSGTYHKMTASYIKVSDMQTGIEPIASPELNDISIFPNPTAGEFRVSSSEFRVGDIEVFDIYGIKQFSTFNFQLSTQIDISYLPAGIYFVRIITEKGIVTKKIIKK